MQLVQYGRLSPGDDLCPPNMRYPGVISPPGVTQTPGASPQETQAEQVRGQIIISTCFNVPISQEKCLILEAIRTVEERCHGQESCSVQASPETLASGLRDPCPTIRYSFIITRLYFK